MHLTDRKLLMKTELSIWEESTIECALKEKTELSLSMVSSMFRHTKTLTKGRKHTFVLNCNNIKNIEWISQSRLIDRMESQFIAIAFIADNKNSKVIANTLVSITTPGFPVKITENIDEARKWLSQYRV